MTNKLFLLVDGRGECFEDAKKAFGNGACINSQIETLTTCCKYYNEDDFLTQLRGVSALENEPSVDKTAILHMPVSGPTITPVPPPPRRISWPKDFQPVDLPDNLVNNSFSLESVIDYLSSLDLSDEEFERQKELYTNQARIIDILKLHGYDIKLIQASDNACSREFSRVIANCVS